MNGYALSHWFPPVASGQLTLRLSAWPGVALNCLFGRDFRGYRSSKILASLAQPLNTIEYTSPIGAFLQWRLALRSLPDFIPTDPLLLML